MSFLHTWTDLLILLMLFMHALFQHIWSWIAIYIHIKYIKIHIYTYLHIHFSTYIQYMYIHILYIVFLRLLMLARVFAHLARVVSKKSSTSQVDVDSFFPRSYDLTSPAQEIPEGDFNGEGAEGCGGEQEPQPQQPKCPCFSFNGNQKGGMEFESMGNHSFGFYGSIFHTGKLQRGWTFWI